MTKFCLKRSRDNVFTMLRNPVDAAISHINYIFTIINSFPDRVDSKDIMQKLDIEDGEKITLHRARELCPRVIEQFVTNLACLSLGTHPTFRSSVEMAQCLGIKISLISQLDDICSYYDVKKVEDCNVSDKFISLCDLPLSVRLYLFDKVGEDIKLLELVVRHTPLCEGLPWRLL